jgi:putative ABC transport system ATP-binding protein
MLRCQSLTRPISPAGGHSPVLNDITYALERGGFLAIVGPSGSGIRTTLLGLLAGLDRPAAGRIELDGNDLGLGCTRISGPGCAPTKVAGSCVNRSPIDSDADGPGETSRVPLELRGEPALARAQQLLERVRPGRTGEPLPAQLSGGEQQRVAVGPGLQHQGRRFSSRESPPEISTHATRATIITLMEELNRELWHHPRCW